MPHFQQLGSAWQIAYQHPMPGQGDDDGKPGVRFGKGISKSAQELTTFRSPGTGLDPELAMSLAPDAHGICTVQTSVINPESYRPSHPASVTAWG